jgi:RNA ligase (TIGR02306 family)
MRAAALLPKLTGERVMGTVAVVGKIVGIRPIDGADFIQAATVVCGSAGKWSGVVGKDVDTGENVTVFLQDALLPPNDRWAFMEKHKWRVRMAKFKGVPSECLIVKGVPDGAGVGDDVAEALGVTKYEKPIPQGMQGDFVGAFPGHIPKTDEPNFQTLPEGWEALMQTAEWYATEKADGSSATAWTDEAGLHVCSRNWELKEFTASGAKNVYWVAARKYGMERLPAGVALQFEVVGPGVQANPMGLPEIEARAFTLRDTINHRYLPRLALEAQCAALGVPMARLIGTSNTLTARNDDELRKLAEIKYQNGKHAEGVVIRALDSSWSFKVINLLYKD